MMNQRSSSASDDGRALYPARNKQMSVSGSTSLRCYGCNTNKNIRAFSETQVKKVSSKYSNSKAALCKQCIPPVADHLLCMVCNRNLELASFSKTQRKNNEKAKCKTCMQDIQDDNSEGDNEIDCENDADYFEVDYEDVM